MLMTLNRRCLHPSVSGCGIYLGSRWRSCIESTNWLLSVLSTLLAISIDWDGLLSTVGLKLEIIESMLHRMRHKDIEDSGGKWNDETKAGIRNLVYLPYSVCCMAILTYSVDGINLWENGVGMGCGSNIMLQGFCVCMLMVSYVIGWWLLNYCYIN